jgi:Fe-S-cluster containining protein
MSNQDVTPDRHLNLRQRIGKTFDMKIKVLVHDLVTRLPKGLKRALGTQKTVDTLIQNSLFQNPKIKEQVKCRQGCGACCFQQVPITDSEKELITQFMVERKIFPSGEESKRIGRQARAARLGEWGRLRHGDKRCVFLDETHSCKIYPVRPMICRSYLVASDPARCDTSNGVQKVDVILINQADLFMTAAFLADHKDGQTESLPEKLSRVF